MARLTALTARRPPPEVDLSKVGQTLTKAYADPDSPHFPRPSYVTQVYGFAEVQVSENPYKLFRGPEYSRFLKFRG